MLIKEDVNDEDGKYMNHLEEQMTSGPIMSCQL